MGTLTLEKGKTYVDNSGNKVHILEVGIKYSNKDYSTIGIVTLPNGEQQARSYSANGVYGSPTGVFSIKKGYVPPIKVRLIVYKYAPKWVQCVYSVLEGGVGFDYNTQRLLGNGALIISDQIIEVEPK